MSDKLVEIEYHEKQDEIFFRDDVRFKVIAKGRRFGLTKGMINYAVERALNGKGEKILWVDTTYPNIQRYIERYAMPILRHLPKGYMDWNKSRNEIKLFTEKEAIIDFRSSDRPENIEGFGYNLIIINEAGIILKNENLWLESIRPMMLDYKADAIIGGTPKGKKYRGKEHLFYKLFKKGKPPLNLPLENGETFADMKELQKAKQGDLFPEEAEKVSNWKSYNYSSYDNPMLDKAEIDELASEISPALRDQEIYGLFVDANTERIIKREWFGVIDRINTEENRKAGKALRIIQSWDTAFKKNQENDFSVCTTWEVWNNRYTLIDIFRERLEFPELKKKVIELNELFKPNEIIIEDKASGISLIQELQRETVLPIKAIKVSSDKISRVHSITPIIEAGNVTLYVLSEHVNKFLDECEDFPNGEFDDMVDSMSQALEYLRNSVVRVEIPRPISRKYRRKKIY
ncbi:MAG: phage terminase large subunit [Bacteroidetes bacterium]|nr:phage terminase large subunit [Bacteroidota bacterium]MBU1115012.1 phage terminase large subunit [Bacteroidota bacterium]MBU1799504.1 phage terminase large subunit [Bacteroidota bacterium]